MPKKKFYSLLVAVVLLGAAGGLGIAMLLRPVVDRVSAMSANATRELVRQAKSGKTNHEAGVASRESTAGVGK